MASNWLRGENKEMKEGWGCYRLNLEEVLVAPLKLLLSACREGLISLSLSVGLGRARDDDCWMSLSISPQFFLLLSYIGYIWMLRVGTVDVALITIVSFRIIRDSQRNSSSPVESRKTHRLCASSHRPFI